MQQTVNQTAMKVFENYNLMKNAWRAQRQFGNAISIHDSPCFRPVLRKTAVKVISRALRCRQGEASGATALRESVNIVATRTDKITSCFNKV